MKVTTEDIERMDRWMVLLAAWVRFRREVGYPGEEPHWLRFGVVSRP